MMLRFVTIVCLLFGSLAWLAGVGTAEVRARPAQPPTATPATPAGQRVDTGPFSVALPPGWTYLPRQGRDSFVGELVGPDLRLTFDYGWYWLSRPDVGAAGYEVLHETVDWRAAELWLARSAPAEVTGLYVAAVTDPDPSLPTTKFSLVGRNLTPAQQDQALAIMRSVRFRRVIPEDGRWEVVAELPHTSLLGLSLQDDGWPVVTGANHSISGTTPVGVVYSRHAGTWQRQVVTGTLIMGDNDRDWAVEFGGHQVLRRDAGGAWRTVLANVPEVLFGIQAVTNGVWVAGIRAIMHFDGATWTSVPGLPGGLGIDLVDDENGWVAGARSLNQQVAGRWQAVDWPGPTDGSVLAVDTLSEREAWFAGGSETTGAGGLWHWQDGAWQVLPDLSQTDLWAIDLASPAEGWAVGGHLSGQQPCELLRLLNGTWSVASAGNDCVGHLHAVAVAPDGTTWAVGYRGVAGGDATQRTGLVLRYAAPALPATATPTATPSPTATRSPSPTSTTVPRSRIFLPFGQKLRAGQSLVRADGLP